MLNARRHRDGDQTKGHKWIYRNLECSTPEGIETVIRSRPGVRLERRAVVLNARRHRDGDQPRCETPGTAGCTCSTPEGIETVISPLVCYQTAMSKSCSTPEGIETVISCFGDFVEPLDDGVLNARRHRDGDQARRREPDNVRGLRAQRPKASRR